MKKIDPRVKIYLVGVISTLAVFYNELLPLSVLFSITLIIVGSLLRGNYSQNVTRYCKGIIKLFFLMVVVQSLFQKSDHVLLQIGRVSILSVDGMQVSLTIIMRMFILVGSAVILTSSSEREMMQGLIQIKVPYEIAFMVMLGIKFLPILKENFTNVYIGFQMRGIDIKRQSIKTKIQLISLMILPVVVGSIERAKQTSISLQIKGFGIYPNRTSCCILRMKKLDYFLMILVTGLGGCFVGLF